jgi:hypothetical protein
MKRKSEQSQTPHRLQTLRNQTKSAWRDPVPLPKSGNRPVAGIDPRTGNFKDSIAS